MPGTGATECQLPRLIRASAAVPPALLTRRTRPKEFPIIPLSRPRLRVESLVALIALYAVAFGNGPWWSAISAGRVASAPGTWLFLGCTFVALAALHFVLFALVSNRWTARPLLTLLVIATAFATYYMRTYAVILDPTMLRNVVKTDVRETRELLSWALFGWVFAWSALPVALIWWVDLERSPAWRAAAFRVAALVGGLVVIVLALLPISRDMTSVMRNQRELRYLITPANFIYSLGRNAANDARGAALPRVALGTDARSLLPADPQRRPRVFVLVLGETARAANFSLFDYPRQTNPELAALDIVAFSDVTSCGTSTEVSVPCMFSRQGRAAYDEQQIRRSEGVLHVLARAGYDVQWLDNQSGCKGVCDGPGITFRKLDAAYAPDLCHGEDCLDEILVRALGEQLAGVTRDTVFVLHTIGNHGPAYYRRYPDAFRRFLPDCRTAELRDCSREEVVNAFDNALLYTDHVVASMIGTLQQASSRLDAALLYVSDHGESLGEGGLYLHGLPWSIAPRVQTHVPMVLWISAGFAAAADLDMACLKKRAAEPLSHDNLFDTMLGAMAVQTSVYRSDLDLFSPCRGTTAALP